MPFQYLIDSKGDTIAVVIPIDDWNKLTEKYGDIEELSQWQKHIIDERLALYKNHPELVISIEQFFDEME